MFLKDVVKSFIDDEDIVEHFTYRGEAHKVDLTRELQLAIIRTEFT